MKHLSLVALLAAIFGATGAAWAAEFTLVEKGRNPVPILLAENAPPDTARAAKDLADYIEKTSGARPEVLATLPDPLPKSAIWVGVQPKAAERFKGVKLAFDHPEEILLVCNGTDLLIAGRDMVVGATQTESGTANAVYTFLQRRLGVRWLWPGLYGEDVLKRETVTLAPFEERSHPVIRQRRMRRRGLDRVKEPQAADWWRFQRTTGSFDMVAGHGFEDWWEKYHEQHPDWFAQRGTHGRTLDPKRGPKVVKLCLSNPGVWAQFLENAEALFKADPARIMVSVSQNDGGGWCICEKCNAWNHPDAPKGVMTDQHVKFWNIVARGLRERFPGREVWVGSWAYGTYRVPPIAEVLEPNVAIGFVGHFPLANDEVRAREKDFWKQWADKASKIVFRPNLFWYSGGGLGLPSVVMRRTIEDYRFLGENKCVGVDVDSQVDYWGSQGVQYYLMAQLMYDPFQDGAALLKDYYQRGFGLAAGEIEAYFDLMEEAHHAVLDKIRHSSSQAGPASIIYREIYTDALLSKAQDILKAAAAKAAAGPEIYRQRVAFVQTGFDFARLQVQIMNAMTLVRESKGADADAVKQAIELCNARTELLKQQSDTFSISVGIQHVYIRNRKLHDFYGPPSEAFREAAGMGKK